VTRHKIVVLGGGMAAVTTAYFLSGSDLIRDRYDIVLYQQGWRLGGKGASGRDPSDHRIEEHGLHVWFGYYENAFRLLRDCHQELNELAEAGDERWSTTMHGIEAGFRPISSIGIVEDEVPGWHPWIATFPEDDLSPWDRDLLSEPPEWDVRWYLTTLLTRTLALVATVMRSAGDEVGLSELAIQPGPGEFEEVLVGLGQRLTDRAHLAAGPADLLAALVTRCVDAMASGADGELYDVAQQVLAAGGRLLDAVRLRIDEQFVIDRASVRRLWALADVQMAIVRGLLYHRVAREEDFEYLDDYEFRSWLRLHGALTESTTSSLMRTVAYDLPFAYEAGDPDLAACGAGTALRTLFRAFFTYRGALMWKMNAGMGDVVFAPLYELLHKRGVTFRFFHQVIDIHADGERVTGFRVRRQGADPYQDEPPADRLLKVKVTPGGWMPPGELRCWPSRPEGWSQDEAETLEAWWGAAPGDETDMEIGPDDRVVFGLPLGIVPHVARRLTTQKEEWKNLVDHVKTTATQAMQLWVDRPAKALGWFEDVVVGGYDSPYDTFSDMPELRFQEQTEAATVLYLCSVLPDPPEGGEPGSDDAAAWVERRRAEVAALADDFLTRRAVGLWPGAQNPATGAYDRDMEIARYVRGNFQPSDRYVLSVPGSLRYRLDPGETGYDNLVVAGDWTRCVINAGCVEAATISGMLAAEAILQSHGSELPVPIIGRAPIEKGGRDVQSIRR
jgi:uncharacterized protein with NAD-binding domain and iron-sulfur cluster